MAEEIKLMPPDDDRKFGLYANVYSIHRNGDMFTFDFGYRESPKVKTADLTSRIHLNKLGAERFCSILQMALKHEPPESGFSRLGEEPIK